MSPTLRIVETEEYGKLLELVEYDNETGYPTTTYHKDGAEFRPSKWDLDYSGRLHFGLSSNTEEFGSGFTAFASLISKLL